MTINEWLNLNPCDNYCMGGFVRDRVVCKDGFSISVQASSCHYCIPRVSNSPSYEAVELGFPSEADSIISDYAEESDLLNSVYGYVPVDVVDSLLEKHGGIVYEG